MPAGLPTRSIDLRQVDHDQPLARGEDVVRREVAVDEPVPGQLGQHVAQLVEVRHQQRRLRPGLRQPGRGLAVDGDPLHQQLGAVDLDRVGDREAELARAA